MFSKYKNSKRIPGVEFLRFIFAILIVLGHAYSEFATKGLPSWIVKQGAIGVEFFFILSGILMAKSIFKNDAQTESYDKIGSETSKFIKNKYLSIFPTHILTFLIMYAEVAYIKKLTSIDNFIFTLPEAFLIQMSGLRLGININPNDWYISAMLLAMLITYPLLRKYRGTFTKVIAPIMSLCIFGYLFQTTGTITPSSTSMMGGLFLKGTLRAIAEICLGVTIYEAIKYINNIEFTKLGKVLIKIIEIGTYISTIVVSCSKINTRWYFIFVFVLAFGLLISFSKHSIFSVFKKSRLLLYLGDLSMTIFVCQRVILLPLSHYTTIKSYWINTGIFIAGTLLLSVLIKWFIDWITLKFKSKKLIVASNNN